MFKIFSRNNVPTQNIVELIHNEVDTAQDRLLQEAIAIISASADNKVSPEELVAAKLKALGFTKTKVVKIAEEKEKQREEISKAHVQGVEQANLINYYSKTYPFLKFLTEQEFDRICKKYNLIYAPVSSYKEDVPLKNLEEIERAQPVYFSDLPENLYELNIIDFFPNVTVPNKLVSSIIGIHKIAREDIFYYSIAEKYLLLIDSHKKLGSKFFGEETFFINKYEIKETDRSGLFIAAPKDHFDLSGVQKNSKFGFFKSKVSKIEDPIVFRFVRGGLQVLTKWGDEANDPALVVPQLN